MDNEFKILKESKKRLVKLKLLSNFFNQASLISIYIKTEIIHSLFKDNRNKFDINKLELFHLQYTDSLIVLLDKIKKQKEATVLLYLNEIHANEEFLEKYTRNNHEDFNNFELERKFHSSDISKFLYNYYQNLINNTIDIEFEKLLSFSKKYSVSYFRQVNNLEDLIDLSTIKYYIFQSISIQKKLLGRLNINLFKARFICGFIANEKVYELFKIFQTNDFFIWDLTKNYFFLIDNEKLSSFDTSKNTSQTISVDRKIEVKNIELKNKIEVTKKTLDNNVLEVLNSYKDTLENVEVLNKSFSFDEETNILKAMLNLNLNNQ